MPDARPLISVHFPKASGSSVRAALQAAFGADRVLADYGADPVDATNPRWIHPDWFARHRPCSVQPYRAVHGHLRIDKYDLLAQAHRIVMLREPVENVISVYYFWHSVTATGLHAAFDLARREALSLLEFARMPSIRYLMSRTYFGDYDMTRFDIVGSYRRRADYLGAVSRLIGRPLDTAVRDNVTPVSQERGNVAADTRLLARLRDLLADDIAFYERHAGRGVDA